MKNDPLFKLVFVAIVAALVIAFAVPSHADVGATPSSADAVVGPAR